MPLLSGDPECPAVPYIENHVGQKNALGAVGDFGLFPGLVGAGAVHRFSNERNQDAVDGEDRSTQPAA